MKKNALILYLLVLSLLLSCGKGDVPDKKKTPFRTVLVYLAANNSLVEEAYNNINQMESAFGDIDGHLLVYARLPGRNPTLYEIVHDLDNGIGSKAVKVYDQHNSSDPEVMNTVIKDAQALYPAKSHGLVLWSHATGWVPPDYGGIKLKSFGDDDGQTMDVKSLGDALPNNLDFLMFDACSMASVEVLVEIADKAKYIIASPGEVISNGMPYESVTRDLFEPGEEAYVNTAQKYIDHYDRKEGAYRSATISVIRADQLHAFAGLTKSILSSGAPFYDDFNRDALQRMDFDRFGNPLIAFDYLDFIEQNYPGFDQDAMRDMLRKLVLYKGNTPYFNGFEIKKFSGLTCYVPHEDNEKTAHAYYRTLKWYTVSGFDSIF